MMGWNCVECGRLLKPGRERMDVNAYATYYVTVQHLICPNCEAEYVTVFRAVGAKDNYIGLIRLPQTT
jgi:hypothetical protein